MRRREISKAVFGGMAGLALTTSTAEAQTCTAPCYPQTPEEFTQSVTPANTARPPGYMSRYASLADALKCNDAVCIDQNVTVSAGVTMTRDGQRIYGISRGVQITFTGSPGPCITMAGHRQAVSDVVLYCEAIHDTAIDFNAIKITGSRCLVERITTLGGWRVGVRLLRALYSCIRDSNIEGWRKRAVSVEGEVIDTRWAGGTFNRIENNFLFQNNPDAPTEAIVFVHNSPSTWVVFNHITQGTGVGIKLVSNPPPVGYVHNFIWVEGNDIDFIRNYAISIDGAWNVHIIDNWCAGGQAPDLGQIVLNNCTFVYVENNDVNGTRGNGKGIHLINCAQGSISHNNVQYSVSNVVLESCTNIVVSENISGQMTGLPDTGSVTQYAYRGVNLDPTQGCQFINNTSVGPTIAAYSGIDRDQILEPRTVTTRANGDAYFKSRSVYIGNGESTSTTPRSLNFRTQHTNVYGSITGGYDDSSVGKISFDGMGVGTDNCALRFYTRNGAGMFERLQVEPAGATRPGADNTYSSGTPSHRWSVMYAASGSISTSDERQKADIGAIPDAILDAWADVHFVQYRWQETKQSKGEAARWHFGLIAQRVRAAFERHGLDPFALGLLCHDKWPAVSERTVIDEATDAAVDGAQSGGDRYGIRYEEALALEAALMRRELERLKSARYS